MISLGFLKAGYSLDELLLGQVGPPRLSRVFSVGQLSCLLSWPVAKNKMSADSQRQSGRLGRSKH
jgi:hypothetical protein